MMWTFFVLNPLEVALVEVAVPSGSVRLALAMLGVLGTVWFLALIATMYKYPHSLDPGQLRLRYRAFFDSRVPVVKIESAAISRRQRSMKRSAKVVDGVLILEVSRATNVSVTLRHEHEVDLGLRGFATALIRAQIT